MVEQRTENPCVGSSNLFLNIIKFFMLNTLWNVCVNLKNGQISRRNFIYQPKTKLTIAFLNILWDEGFILGYTIDNIDVNRVKVFFKYKKGTPVIHLIKFIYTPSRNISYSVTQLWKFDLKKSLIVLTTPKGLMTSYECLRTQTGGKPLFLIK